MNKQEMEAARRELDDRDLDGRSELLAFDCTQVAGGNIFRGRQPADLSAAEMGFVRHLHAELLPAIRADAEMVFMTEWPATRGEAREAMEVGDDAINRAVLAAVDAAVAKSEDLPADVLRGVAKFKARIKRRGLHSDAALAAREESLAKLPTCQECGE